MLKIRPKKISVFGATWPKKRGSVGLMQIFHVWGLVQEIMGDQDLLLLFLQMALFWKIGRRKHFYILSKFMKYKRPIGLIAPPFKINFLATETWPKMKLKSVRILQKIIHLASGCHIWSFFAQNHMLTKSKSRSIASQITNLASRKSYLVIILPNSYQK